jgi:chromosome segregation ATPase
VHPTLGSNPSDGQSVYQIVEDLVGERIEALASWIQELDAQVRATSVAGDENTLKELRRALEAWSKRDPKFEERLTDRIDVLADRLATLSSAVNTTAAAHAGSDGEIANLRRELEHETAKMQSALRELRPTTVSGDVEDLRRAIAQLSVDRPTGKDDKRVSGLHEKVDNLGERVDTLAKTVATTAAGLAGREGELALLRRSLEDGNARVEQMVADVRRDTDRSDIGELDARLESLAHKVSTATSGLAAREGDVAALRARLEDEDAKMQTVVGELRKSLGDLSSQVAAVHERPHDTDLIDALERRVQATGTKVAALAEQLDSVATSAESASAGLASRDAELSSLRARLQDEDTKVEAVVTELTASIGALSAQITAIEARADTAATEALATGVEDANAKIAALASKLTLISANNASSSASLAQNELELEALRGEFQAANIRLGAAVGELRQALDALPEPGSVDASLDARLEQLAAKIDAIGSRLADVDATSNELRAETESRTAELERLLTDGRQRLSEVESASDRTATELARASQTWAEERTLVREQIDALAAAAAEMPSAVDVDLKVGDLSTRIASSEVGRSEVASEIARLTGAWDEERTWVRERLDALATAARDMPSASNVDLALAELGKRLASIELREESAAAEAERERATWGAERQALAAQLTELSSARAGQASEGGSEELVEELARRLNTIEHDGAATASEISRAGAFWAAETDAIEKRLHEVTSRMRALVAGGQQAFPQVASDEDVGELRGHVDELRTRLASAENALAAQARPHDVGAQLDELVSRVSSLEEGGTVAAAPAAAAGDGRFRVELRALDLRMQHAEAAARENREAVLLQLERLASRIEWRLQRLEAEEDDSEPDEPQREALGQVVPIRGGVET